MSLAQQLIARGEARGIVVGEARGIVVGEARGIVVGEARGEARGVWIGKIQLLEQLQGSEITPTVALESLDLPKLEARFIELEQTYSAKFKQR